MKRVLIISYYWPPSAGSGVQRWLKFAKYLPQFGWQPVILTPENPDFGLKDESLIKDIPRECEVLKLKIWEPYGLAKLISRKKKINTGIVTKSEKQNLKSRIMNWIRGNIFIPDPRIFWRRPAVRFLKKYLTEHPCDVIISTGPPHSMHLIAYDIKKQLGINWIMDIRDPWSKLDFLDTFNLTKRTRSKYHKLESSSLELCDAVIATSYSMPQLLMPFDKKKFSCITNGFDQDDFNNLEAAEKDSDQFVLYHAGLLNTVRNPILLWEAISKLADSDERFRKKFRLHLVGTIDPQIVEEMKDFKQLDELVQVEAYKSHDEVLKDYLNADALLMLINNTDNANVNIPGKLFEYLALQKPILSLGADSTDAHSIIRETGHGLCFPYDDFVGIQTALSDLFYERFKIKTSNVNQFSRKSLTEKLVKKMESL